MKTYIHRIGMLRHWLTLKLIFINLAHFTFLLVAGGHTRHLPVLYCTIRKQPSLYNIVIHTFVSFSPK